MKTIKSRVGIFKKFLFLLSMFVLAVNCQRDESADIDADGGQPSTEVSPRQLQNRAREIVSSEEYNNALNQSELFIKKIHDEHFFTEDLFDVENNTYNYDLIKERLSMTSFKSADEFVQEYEKMFYSIQKLVKKNPELADSSMELQEMIKNEDLKRINLLDSRSSASKCKKAYEACKDDKFVNYITSVGGCVFLVEAGPAFLACMGLFSGQVLAGYYSCKRMYNLCKED